MIGYLAMLAVVQGSIGASPVNPTKSVGAPAKDYVHLTPEQLIEISDQLIFEDIAEVDIDPEAFDLPVGKPKRIKKDALDEVEFISERPKQQAPVR